MRITMMAAISGVVVSGVFIALQGASAESPRRAPSLAALLDASTDRGMGQAEESRIGNDQPETTGDEMEVAIDNGNNAFARAVAGTYVDDGEFLDGVITFVGTVTVNSDGTMRATNSNCCGADNPDANTGGTNLQSPGHGNWKRTGTRQIAITAITYVQTFLPDEVDCPLGCPAEDGVLAARPNLIVDFAPDFKSAEATFMTDIFLLRQDFDNDGVLDYLDPDGVPLVTIPGSATWTRLPVNG